MTHWRRSGDRVQSEGLLKQLDLEKMIEADLSSSEVARLKATLCGDGSMPLLRNVWFELDGVGVSAPRWRGPGVQGAVTLHKE